MSHTTEPWIVETGYDGGKQKLFVTTQYNDGFRPWTDEDAKRIVECVNGCKGIKNPAAIGQLLAAVNRLWAAKEALEITDSPQDATILRELYNAWLDLRDARNAVEGH